MTTAHAEILNRPPNGEDIAAGYTFGTSPTISPTGCRHSAVYEDAVCQKFAPRPQNPAGMSGPSLWEHSHPQGEWKEELRRLSDTRLSHMAR
ncbi:hypothetical protein E5D57_012944 [Metarhizium anisopliae]|nr:hypothetical protein E5D57_012944 [Metarhizium anisopliae]